MEATKRTQGETSGAVHSCRSVNDGFVHVHRLGIGGGRDVEIGVGRL